MRLLTTLLILITGSAFAEYRVYQYFIKNKQVTDPQAYLQLSSLDPVSFSSYHGGNASVRIDLLRSWICKGHTGGMQNYCDSPLKLKDNQVESINE